jgi:hypothetical protein
MTDKITLSFFITREDTLKALEHHKTFNPDVKQSNKRLLWALFLPLYWFYLMYSGGRYTFWEAVYQTLLLTLIAGAAIFAFAFVLSFVLKKLLNTYYKWDHQRQLKKAALEDHSDRENTIYSFDDDKIEIIYQGKTDKHDWSGIDDIFEYPEGFLFLNKDKQVELLIPKRAFETDFKQKLFREFAKRKFGEKATVNLFST